MSVEQGWNLDRRVTSTLQSVTNIIEAMLDMPKTMIVRNVVWRSCVPVGSFKFFGVKLSVHELPEHMTNSSLSYISRRYW